MPPSSAEHGPARLLLTALAVLAATPLAAQINAAAPSRLVSVIDVTPNENQVEVTMVFNCSLRFISNLPANEGRVVRIQFRPLPDCGLSPLALIPSETPSVLGGAPFLTSAQLDSTAPGQVTLTLEFRQTL